MTEIDLVPPRYHRSQMIRRWLLRSGIVYLGVLLTVLAARVVIASRTSDFDREIESLQVERARAELEQRRRTELDSEKRLLEQRLLVLDGLRGGIAAKRMFSVVDESLDESVWFRRWKFLRAGEIVDEGPGAVETGYFIVLPQESKDAPRRAWRLQTHMEILAQASDHAALASFVRELSKQPEIESARILNTKVRRRETSGRVDFELAVSVRSAR